MNILTRVKNWVFGTTQLAAEPRQSSKRQSLKSKLQLMPASRVEHGILELDNAIAAAKNPLNTTRVTLYDIYETIADDDEYIAQRRILQETIIGLTFRVSKNNKEDSKRTEIFQKQWFSEYIRHYIDTTFWGFTVLQFFPQTMKFELVPRRHVQAWRDTIAFDANGTEGIAISEQADCLAIGSPDDLGLLRIIARQAIRKKYAMSDWSRRSEKFGMPITIMNTQTTDANELKAMENMLTNLGANSWMLLDDTDKVTFAESSQTDAYKIYKELAATCDDKIAKIMVGQTGTSNNGAWAGTADVHQNIFLLLTKAIARDLTFNINDVLIPFLVRNGLPQLQGAKFEFINPTPASIPPPQSTPAPQPQAAQLAASQPQAAQLAAPIDIDKIIERVIRRVHKGIYKAGDIPKELFNYTFKKLSQQIPKNLAIADVIRKNIATFAAFKTHSNIAELVATLTSEDGKLRTFADWRSDATSICDKYNRQWLETEFNHARTCGQMAMRWQEIKENADTFPMLRYDAVNDDHTRAGHAKLDGVTLPVSDPFWQQFLPPNGWGCRCSVVQLADAPSIPPKYPPTTEDVPAMFRGNVGENDWFNSEHTYFKVNADERAKILSELKKLT